MDHTEPVDYTDLENILKNISTGNSEDLFKKYFFVYQHSKQFIEECVDYSPETNISFKDTDPLQYRSLSKMPYVSNHNKIIRIEAHFLDNLSSLEMLPDLEIQPNDITVHPSVVVLGWNMNYPIEVQDEQEAIVRDTFAQILSDTGMHGNIKIHFFYETTRKVVKPKI